MRIRTTGTLDEDVLDQVRRESRFRGTSFRRTLNDLLRFALLARQQPPDRRSFRVKPSPMGLRSGLNYDHAEGLLEFGEGATHK